MASSRIQPESIADGAPSTDWLVAFSGGLDSTALLHLACEAARQQGDLSVRAVHVDHGLHPKSAEWAEQCRRVAATLGVHCELRRVAVDAASGQGLEAAARQARHAALQAVMRPGETVLMAHHRDDQAETLLLNLARGAGVDGLAGMPQTRPFGIGWLYRPLLEHPRAALQDWLLERGIAWIDDPSNQDVSLDRNFLRHEVLPLLRQRWPAIETKLAATTVHARAAAEALSDNDHQWLPALASGDGWSVSALTRLDDAVLARALRLMLSTQGYPLPSQAVLSEVMAMLRSQRTDAEHLISWAGVEARRYRDTLYLQPVQTSLPPGWSADWDGRQALHLPAGLGRLEGAGPGQWTVRFARFDDVVRQPGRPGKRLTRWCQEQGVPPWLRGRLPVVLREGRMCSLGAWVMDAQCAPEKLQWIHAIAGMPRCCSDCSDAGDRLPSALP